MCLLELRFSCAAVTLESSTFQFHDTPGVWDGKTIHKVLKGGSVLYILMEDDQESPFHSEASLQTNESIKMDNLGKPKDTNPVAGKTTSDLEQMETEEQDISEKLKSLIIQGEEGKTTSDLEQMETEEQDICEKLKSQMAQGEEDLPRKMFMNLQQMRVSKVKSKTDLLAELEKIASGKGFVISDNEELGNSMFYALSEQLKLVKGIKISHEELRQSIVQYLRKNPKLPDGTDLFNFINGYRSWEDYLTKMEQDGTSGDHVILYATANCYKTYIHVISSQSNHRDLTIRPDGHVIGTDPLVLGHVHEVHYVSLQPKQGKTTSDLEQMETEEQATSEKLKSEMAQLQGDKGKTTSDLEQMETEEQDISEKLKSQMAQGEEVDERVVWTAAIEFEDKHKECVRVLPYSPNGGDVEIHVYVYSDRYGIPTELKNAAQASFGEKGWKFICKDLFNDAFNLLKVTSIEYSSEEPKRLEASQVAEIDDVINKHLHVFSKHRNVTAVQPSFKVTNSKQTQEACIVVYVLGKGQIPLGESAIPCTIGSYPVDIVNGFCVRTNDPEEPEKAHKQKEFLRLGASIGISGKVSSATLGAIVEDENSGTLYALSCDHVMNDADEKEIIHPGLDVYRNYLLYHLHNYAAYIKDGIGSAAEVPQLPHANLDETELEERFNHLKTLKETYSASGECYFRPKLSKNILSHENKLEEAFGKRPRVIAKYCAGVRCNVKNNGEEHFIDAAIAELNKDEVQKVKGEKKVEIIGTRRYPSGECVLATAKVGDLFKSGSATGFTQSNRLAEEMGDRPTYIRVQGNGNWIHVECINCKNTKQGQSQAQSQGQSQGRSQGQSEAQDPVSYCEQCKPDGWCKRCLCIQPQRKEKAFSAKGDSGAVIFENRGDCLESPGFAIIFGELESAHCKFALASPLRIALEALSQKVSNSITDSQPCKLKLASKFQTI